MRQSLTHIALVVRDYDEAIAFYCGILGFDLLEDTYQPEQQAFVGNQTGGRVFLFLNTDNFDRDYSRLLEAGVEFVRPPVMQDYGTVAVFRDLYGNLWDLLQLKDGHPAAV